VGDCIEGEEGNSSTSMLMVRAIYTFPCRDISFHSRAASLFPSLPPRLGCPHPRPTAGYREVMLPASGVHVVLLLHSRPGRRQTRTKIGTLTFLSLHSQLYLRLHFVSTVTLFQALRLRIAANRNFQSPGGLPEQSWRPMSSFVRRPIAWEQSISLLRPL
jgi:hypothetical protein